MPLLRQVPRRRQRLPAGQRSRSLRGAGVLDEYMQRDSVQLRRFGDSRSSRMWRVRFVILDKLSRQMRWEGSVRKDEVRGAVMSGKVRGPPKHGASAAQIATGVIVGEFDGYQLQ